MAKCAFCPSDAKLTGEHVWSDWICELFPDVRVTFRKWGYDPSVPEKRWDADSMDHEVKVVCKACNEGWMSNLESQHAQPSMKSPILSDAPLMLSTKQLVSIAIFAFKTAVIGDATERKRSPFFRVEMRREFAATLRMPAGFQVWIGCIDESDPHHGVFRRRYWESPPRAARGFHIYNTTWGIGRFLFQATATKWADVRDRHFMVPHLTQSEEWNRYSIPIWPMMNGPIEESWPPIGHIGHDILYEYGERWGRVGISDPKLMG
jgi:hypothetical protein